MISKISRLKLLFLFGPILGVFIVGCSFQPKSPEPQITPYSLILTATARAYAEEYIPLEPGSQKLSYPTVVTGLREWMASDDGLQELPDKLLYDFFTPPGRVILLLGSDKFPLIDSPEGAHVKIFEYTDLASREAESVGIAADGLTVSGALTDWDSQPNFWAVGKVILLYEGEDPVVQGLISAVVGEPLTPHTALESGFPLAIERALDTYIQSTSPEAQIEIYTYQQVEYGDDCLDIPDPGEACAEVSTPGWILLLLVDGDEVEIRTSIDGGSPRLR